MAGSSANGNRDPQMRYPLPKVTPGRQDNRNTTAPRGVSGTRYGMQSPAPIRSTTERIKPLNPSSARERINSGANSKPTAKKSTKRGFFCSSSTRDFLLGFAIGIAVFGVAAVIICTALINLIS